MPPVIIPPVAGIATLSDALITTPADGQVLEYSAGAAKWENGPPVSASSRFLARLEGALTWTGGSAGSVPFNVIEEDPESGWDDVTSHWYVTTSGVYLIEAKVSVGSTTTGVLDLTLRAGGATLTDHVSAAGRLSPSISITTSRTYRPIVAGNPISIGVGGYGATVDLAGSEYATSLRIMFVSPL